MQRFDVIPGSVVRQLLGDRKAVIDVVQSAYRQHGRGLTTNPDSYFLRFPDKPSSRIIALPARLSLDDGGDVAGIKWIASFPENVTQGNPRASAVLVLNSTVTGYPYALLEAAGISAARTAASAAVTATSIARTVSPTGELGIIGAGVIARTVVDHLLAAGHPLAHVVVHDRDAASAAHLVRHARGLGLEARADTLDAALDRQLVVTATTALTPYIDRAPAPGQVVLNLSLRDYTPDALADVQNVLDDVDHCLKAQTSPHLLEQRTGSRDFVTGTIPELLLGKLDVSPERGVVVSPFGLGVLDLAVGGWVHDAAVRAGLAVEVPGFFGEETRW